MKIVGEKLEQIANSERDVIKKDLFGRSAFNRYYYAAFLTAREMLGELNPRWKHTAHKEIPNLLKTSVRKYAVNKLRQNVRSDLITNGEMSALQREITIATAELANLLTQAYDVRLVADYEPEKMVIVKNNSITLHFNKLTSANAWENKARYYCKNIRKVWEEAGLA